MALYRSKLGPVGGAGEGGTRDGGVVVDLDPLSAFALMGGGGAEADTSAPASNSRGAEHGLAPGGGATRPGKEKSAAPVAARPGAADNTLDLGSWHMTDLAPAAPPSQPLVTTDDATGNRGYPPAAPSTAVYPVTPAHRPPVRRLSSLIATPSPPRQLRALRESSQLNNWKAGDMKTGGGGGGGGAAVGGVPPLEDGGSNEGSTEKIDPLEILRVEGIECLDGELLLVKLQNASFEGLHGKMVPGVLIMTTYKLLLVPHRLPRRGTSSVNNSSAQGSAAGPDERFFPFGHLPKEYVQVPMTYIDKIERDSDRKGTQRVDRYFNADSAATIHCKDARRLRVSFGGPEESERAMKMLQQLAFPGNQMEHLFAFSHRTVAAGSPDPGWHIYDPLKEFDRMGALKSRRNGASPWRTTDLNYNYGLCASYPSVLVVPASVTDVEIEAVAQFRSEQRVPVLCWGRRADSASIWRSSQPKIGMSRAACAEDELMLARVAASSPSRILPIVDCRPRSNATANFAAGYGYESYPDCPLEFSGIGNIHVMRESLAKLENLCLGNTARDLDWTAAVEESKWLNHLRIVLSAAWTVAFKAHTQRTPVLVHCSHGWDRTSQVCSLAQMLLDPYYRTIDGFQVLIEKEWLAFGHPFHLRHAYGLPRGATSGKEERSPIFLQFLDCTWQLVMQLPSYFEFNPRYLLCIADHIQSCRFGTFLCNTNKARRDANLEERCSSLWTFLELHRPSFLSHLYSLDGQGELLPSLVSVHRHVRLWSDYFLRWSPAPSFLPLPASIRDADNGGAVHGQSGGGKSPAATAEGSQTRSPPPPEKDGNAPLPAFRCEFDETERWVKLYEREAVILRQKVLDRDADAAQGASKWSGGSIGASESQRPESEELAAAREEIAQLKAALAEKDQVLSVMVEAGARSPVVAARASPHAQSAPSKPSMTMCARPSDKTTSRMTTTARTHSQSSGSLALEEADSDDLEPETSSDGSDGGGAMSRPRGHSSTMESREVRRSSLGEMSADEERGRCLTGAKPDVMLDAVERDREESETRVGNRQGARTGASWKWDYKGWTQAGGGGRTNANGVVMGPKARARK